MIMYPYLPHIVIHHIVFSYALICSIPLLSNTNTVQNWFSNYKYTQEELLELTPKQSPCVLSVTHQLPGTVSIKGWHQNHIAVTVHKKTQTADDAERVQCILTENKNGTVALAVHNNNELRKSVIVDLTIHIPINSTTNIQAQDDVTIENTRNTIRIETEQGDVTTRSTWGAVHAHIEKGNITIHEAHEAIQVYTEKGSITIDRSYNSVIAETERGFIKTKCAHIPSTATIKLATNTHGAITVAVPESTEACIVAHTVRGIITSNVLITVERHTTLLNADTYKDAQKHLRGIIGEQGNANIVINSARGIYITPLSNDTL